MHVFLFLLFFLGISLNILPSFASTYWITRWRRTKSLSRNNKVSLAPCVNLGKPETHFWAELQQQYTNYKNSLQQLAQRIGDVEQEAEEHKCVILQPKLDPIQRGSLLWRWVKH